MKVSIHFGLTDKSYTKCVKFEGGRNEMFVTINVVQKIVTK